MTLHWHHTLTVKTLKNIIARTATSPELHQHVFVGARCLADDEAVEEGYINDVFVLCVCSSEGCWTEGEAGRDRPCGSPLADGGRSRFL